ncbi:hypothetical protein LX16_2993 [Stackebrandtia albiflava]|uniref:Uncharacterized protein n=1 Tax=Stackebrandtia albiflava TaxID=406432 RepID=A0A562V306_9ACTN|nr:hypothetical protein [Stackebrandtia albiflava]TWJ12238.1 hypothetical protein LX16_2993 [Stackebrandtia albiflava]
MTNNDTITARFSDTEKNTIRVAAYGAVTLLAAAAAASGSPHKTATRGAIALGAATGPIGHVLARYPKGRDLTGKSVAAIADRVLAALGEAGRLLRATDPALAADFRHIVDTALRTADPAPTPATTDMTARIHQAIGD